MNRIAEFIHPLIIRYHQRKRCFCCNGPSTKTCRTHGTQICDSAFCRMEHRRMKGAIRGSLLNPFCDVRAGVDWIGYAVRSMVVIAVGTFAAWLIVWL